MSGKESLSRQLCPLRGNSGRRKRETRYWRALAPSLNLVFSNVSIPRLCRVLMVVSHHLTPLARVLVVTVLGTLSPTPFSLGLLILSLPCLSQSGCPLILFLQRTGFLIHMVPSLVSHLGEMGQRKEAQLHFGWNPKLPIYCLPPILGPRISCALIPGIFRGSRGAVETRRDSCAQAWLL